MRRQKLNRALKKAVYPTLLILCFHIIIIQGEFSLLPIIWFWELLKKLSRAIWSLPKETLHSQCHVIFSRNSILIANVKKPTL